MTGFKLLIERRRSLKDGCHSSKEENEWQSGSITTECALREKGQRDLDCRIHTKRTYVEQAIPEARTRAKAEQAQTKIKRDIFDDKYNRAGGNQINFGVKLVSLDILQLSNRLRETRLHSFCTSNLLKIMATDSSASSRIKILRRRFLQTTRSITQYQQFNTKTNSIANPIRSGN